jgi:hypothetical protein
MRAIDRTHCGPKEATCAACGQIIGAYESRHYGPTGAIHAFDPAHYGDPGARPCNPELYPKVFCSGLYPNYYTDG